MRQLVIILRGWVVGIGFVFLATCRLLSSRRPKNRLLAKKGFLDCESILDSQSPPRNRGRRRPAKPVPSIECC